MLFPGQGSQSVGMGQDLYESNEIGKEYYQRADAVLGFEISELCFLGPTEKLQQTEFTQPAIFVHSYICFKILESQGIVPQVVAGHSLGEYSALVAAGAVDFENGLRIVRQRGLLMQKAGEKRPGAMAVLLGADPTKVKQLCEAVQEQGLVQPANFNSPEQIVISGEVKAVEAALGKSKALGIKRALRLPVSGAFHSSLMNETQNEFRQALLSLPLREPRVPVVTNVTARAVKECEEIRGLLLQQLTSPVRWTEAMQTLVELGYRKGLEVGPGSVLSGLMKKIDIRFECTPMGKLVDFQNLS